MPTDEDFEEPQVDDIHTTHRDRIASNNRQSLPLPLCVARPVGAAETRASPEAQKAILKEWSRLREKNVWDERITHVREWNDVAAEARRTGKTVHLGYLLGLTTEKGSELADNDANKKMKHRVVFRGDDVKDQN